MGTVPRWPPCLGAHGGQSFTVASEACTIPVADRQDDAQPTRGRPFCAKVRTKRAVSHAKSENDEVKSAAGRTFTPIVLTFYLIVRTLNLIVLAFTENVLAQSETSRAFYLIVRTLTLNFLTFYLNGRT